MRRRRPCSSQKTLALATRSISPGRDGTRGSEASPPAARGSSSSGRTRRTIRRRRRPTCRSLRAPPCRFLPVRANALRLSCVWERRAGGANICQTVRKKQDAPVGYEKGAAARESSEPLQCRLKEGNYAASSSYGMNRGFSRENRRDLGTLSRSRGSVKLSVNLYECRQVKCRNVRSLSSRIVRR